MESVPSKYFKKLKVLMIDSNPKREKVDVSKIMFIKCTSTPDIDYDSIKPGC